MFGGERSLACMGPASQTMLSSNMNQQMDSQCYVVGSKKCSQSLNNAVHFHIKWKNVSIILIHKLQKCCCCYKVFIVPWASFWTSSWLHGQEVGTVQLMRPCYNKTFFICRPVSRFMIVPNYNEIDIMVLKLWFKKIRLKKTKGKGPYRVLCKV